MKSFTTRAAVILAIAAAPGAAFAADLATKAPLQSVITSTDPFTGFYIGAHGGYGFNTSGAGAFAVENASDLAASPQGFDLGLHAGLGTRFASQLLYAGIEADIDLANLKGSAANPNAGLITASSKDDVFGTVRARLGVFLLPTLMVYGTAGLAYGDPSASFTLAGPNPTTFNSSSTKMGWAAGGGVEFALTGNWLARAEWIRVDLGKITVTDGAVATLTAPFQVDLFRAGVSYKF
jgi:outer membrane immunogenic protein